MGYYENSSQSLERFKSAQIGREALENTYKKSRKRDFTHEKPNTSSMLWTTREGKKLKVSDMDDNHLNNAINMLKRNNKMQAYNILKAEQDYRNSIKSSETCPNCKSTLVYGDCVKCGFDATEVDIY